MGRFGSLKDQKKALSDVQSETLRAPVVAPITKRGNPAYQQFSAYLPTAKYRRFKAHLAANGVELSDAVERAIDLFMQQQSGV
jgi:hypothetical protein